MLRIPRDSVITKIIGKPSGTIATNIAIAIINCSTATSSNDSELSLTYAKAMFNVTNRTATTSATNPRNFPNDSNLTSSGVLGVSVDDIPLAI